MDTKSSIRVEVKDADRGEVQVVFSTLDVVDSDGDVTRAGAFTDGEKVRISAYGHASWGGALPVGKGVIRQVKNEAVMDGQFFMDTTAGRDHFLVVKALDELQEWSYGFDVTKASFGEHDGHDVRFLEGLKVHEVSPVLLGAGVGTRTIGAKGAHRFTDEARLVLVQLDALAGRAADVMAMRRSKGKELGDEAAELLAQVKASSERLAEVLATEPGSIPPTEDELRGQVAVLASRVRRLAITA